VLETYLVGGHPNRWHADRLLLAFVSAGALYCTVRSLLPPFSAAVVTLLFFSGRQNDIWVRLGPAETYGVPFCLLGLVWIAVSAGRGQWRPTRLLPGFALIWLAGLMKESFIPILPGVLVFLYIVIPVLLRPFGPRLSQFTLLDALALIVVLLS